MSFEGPAGGGRPGAEIGRREDSTDRVIMKYKFAQRNYVRGRKASRPPRAIEEKAVETSIDPTPESLKALLDKVPGDRPVFMLNLLRFRAEAAYGGSGDAPCSGREAYARYGREVLAFLRAVEGEVVWRAQAHHAFIAPPGEQWDEAMLVRYPSRDAFVAMLKDPGYRAITRHRTAALRDSRLIATCAEDTVRRGPA